jgi:hypothetical protein
MSVFKLSPIELLNTYHQTVLPLELELVDDELYDPGVGLAETDTGDLVGVLDRRKLVISWGTVLPPAGSLKRPTRKFSSLFVPTRIALFCWITIEAFASLL